MDIDATDDSLTFLLGVMLAGAAGLVYALFETNVWYFQGFEGRAVRVHRRRDGRHRQRSRRRARRPDHRRDPGPGGPRMGRSGPRRSCSGPDHDHGPAPAGLLGERRGRRGERLDAKNRTSEHRSRDRVAEPGPPDRAERRCTNGEKGVERLLPPGGAARGRDLIVIGIVLPFLFSAGRTGFLNATIIAVAYAVMSLGLNIVVGFAGCSISATSRSTRSALIRWAGSARLLLQGARARARPGVASAPPGST